MKAATSPESPNEQTVLSLTDPENPTGKKARVSQTRQEVVHRLIHDHQKKPMVQIKRFLSKSIFS